MKRVPPEKSGTLALFVLTLGALVACSDRVSDEGSAPANPAMESGEPFSQTLSSTPPDPSSAPNEQTGKDNMQKLYLQPLEYPYSNEWFGYLKKSDGDWRDVYVETNDKLPAKGVLSFDCPGRGATGGTMVAFLEELEDGSEGAITKYTDAEFEEWKIDDYAIPPYELYIAVQSKFC